MPIEPDPVAMIEERDRELAVTRQAVSDLAAAYDALRDLFAATAAHIGCRTCKQAMVRHAETLTKAKAAVR